MLFCAAYSDLCWSGWTEQLLTSEVWLVISRSLAKCQFCSYSVVQAFARSHSSHTGQGQSKISSSGTSLDTVTAIWYWGTQDYGTKGEDERRWVEVTTCCCSWLGLWQWCPCSKTEVHAVLMYNCNRLARHMIVGLSFHCSHSGSRLVMVQYVQNISDGKWLWKCLTVWQVQTAHFRNKWTTLLCSWSFLEILNFLWCLCWIVSSFHLPHYINIL